MAGQGTGVILRQMRVLLGSGTCLGLSDRQLLERFLERRDEVSELAFAVLVERHGPMVLGVCRRITGNSHDADDAFQATFLVLARRARSIHVEGSLGRWLFGVATRVATRARSDVRRRRARERCGLDRIDAAGPDAGSDAVDRAEIHGMIAREIAALPDRFRAPVLLCDLEGTSCEEAAHRLGWPVGTVKSRLSRARARLRQRLTRRGLTPADLSIVAAAWRAAPAPSLVAATTRAAVIVISGSLTMAGVVPASVATLTHGVLRTMIPTPLKLAAAGLMLAATGAAALLGQDSTPRPPVRVDRPLRAAPAAGAKASPAAGDQLDLEMLERAWVDAVNRRDKAVVSRILADDFEGIDQAGNHFDKPEAVQEPLLGAFLTDAYAALEQVKARLYGDTAVVTSRVKLRDSQARGAMTHVYIRRGGRWQCIASHASWASGAVCPAVGPIAERTPSSTREARYLLRPTDEMTSNCLSCHSADHRKETRIDHSPEDYYAAINAKTESRGPLAVTIGPAGIQIAGKEIEPEPKALEVRFRAARDAEGQAKVVLSVFHATPFWTIKMVTDAAQRVGLRDISLEPVVDHPDRTAQPIKSGPATGDAARP